MDKDVAHIYNSIFSSVQFSRSVVSLCDPMNHSMPGLLFITNSQSLLKLMPIELMMPSSHLILCCPLLLLSPILPSIGVFSNESTLCMKWPKYWSFSFSISPSNEHPGLISFRMDWLDLLAVQGTLKSLLQHCSSKASIFQCSACSAIKRSEIASLAETWMDIEPVTQWRKSEREKQISCGFAFPLPERMKIISPLL